TLTDVTYITNFGFVALDVAEFIARDRGYWSKLGLNVTLQGGAGSAGASQVAAGNAQFSLQTGTTQSQLNAQGAGLLAVASPIPFFDGGIAYWPDKAISKPADLQGKTLVSTAGGFFALLLPIWAQKEGVDLSKITIQYTDPGSATALFSSWS